MLVGDVSRGSPADLCGFRRGDLIVAAGDLEVRKMKDLLLALAKVAVGDGVKLIVMRNSRRYEVTARLEEAPVQMVDRRRR